MKLSCADWLVPSTLIKTVYVHYDGNLGELTTKLNWTETIAAYIW